jgi:hypothetical protein
MSSVRAEPKEWSPFAVVVHGVLEMGSAEVRYIGLTTKTIRRRRSEHFMNADRGIKTPFADWLRTYQSREDVFFGSLELVISDDIEGDLVRSSQGHERGRDESELRQVRAGASVVWPHHVAGIASETL